MKISSYVRVVGHYQILQYLEATIEHFPIRFAASSCTSGGSSNQYSSMRSERTIEVVVIMVISSFNSG